MTVYTEKGVVGGDLLIYCPAIEYACVGATVDNATAAGSGGAGATNEIEDVTGLPVRDNGGTWELVETADIAEADGIILKGPTLEALEPGNTSANEYLILKHGEQVILNQNGLSADDPWGDAYNQTNYRARLAALNYELRDVSVKISTQTE